MTDPTNPFQDRAEVMRALAAACFPTLRADILSLLASARALNASEIADALEAGTPRYGFRAICDTLDALAAEGALTITFGAGGRRHWSRPDVGRGKP